MRACLLASVLALTSGAATAAPEQALEIGPGSVLYWTNAYEGGSDTFREKLLVQGDDFALYQSASDWTAGDATDFFALFSGIYFNTCDLEMPTAEEREALAGLWPLTPGAKVEIATDEGASFEVLEATEFFLMGQWRPAHAIRISYKGEEPSEETIYVLDDTPLTVGVLWDEGGRDAVTLVTRPKSVASSQVDADLIGTCAALLNEQENEN